VVTDTRLSEVDGERGELLIAGLPVEQVAAGGFESACALLWDSVSTAPAAIPDATRQGEIATELGLARRRAWTLLGDLGGALSLPNAMDALRASMAHLSASAWPDDAPRLTGAMAVFAAAWGRICEGKAPIEPHPRRTHAADYLRMLHGQVPTPAEERALSTYLATVCEHGMNASTFAARIVASTESDSVSSVVAGIGALKGRLHGGAPGPVLDMLDAIADSGDASAWLRAEIARGQRIMGMGHRVYRTRDPRAHVLEAALTVLDRKSRRIALARDVEATAERLLAAAKPGRALRANVEFYTAVLLEALAIPRTMFTATFAVGRVAGWCAHSEEQRQSGRLIRPRARYVGARPAA
jgi:citrate synthase